MLRSVVKCMGGVLIYNFENRIYNFIVTFLLYLQDFSIFFSALIVSFIHINI